MRNHRLSAPASALRRVGRDGSFPPMARMGLLCDVARTAAETPPPEPAPAGSGSVPSPSCPASRHRPDTHLLYIESRIAKEACARPEPLQHVPSHGRKRQKPPFADPRTGNGRPRGKKTKNRKIIVDTRQGCRLYTPHQRRRPRCWRQRSSLLSFAKSWTKSREPRERHSTGPKPKA